MVPQLSLTVGRHSAAVILGTLNGTAPALGPSITGGQSGDSLPVDENSLSIIASGVVELVWGAG